MTNSWHLVTKVLVTRHQCSIPSEEYSATHTGAVSGLREEQNLNIWGAQLYPMGVIRVLLLLLPDHSAAHPQPRIHGSHFPVCAGHRDSSKCAPYTPSCDARPTDDLGLSSLPATQLWEPL